MTNRNAKRTFLAVFFFIQVAAAQSAPPRKDIPSIAKAANGAIVTIITAANDKPIAQGTGFVVSADGVIVTNYHVVETGNVAIVKFPDDTAFPVDGVLAADKVRDLAIIKIHGKAFRTLALGDSDDIQVGEEVVAIGNPLLLESTVSNGIISGVRTLEEQGGKFLQTTAPISPGSSGGPLFNMRGEVVGINTLFLKVGENLNFAIPVNDVKRLLSHQSAKLQNLPNEQESASADAPPATPDKRPSVQTKQTKDTYYVRARKNETYILEYRGHQLTAHCREALVWNDGTDKPGGPMSDECIYMLDKVGEHIDADLMVRQDNELRYRPLAGDPDSLQVADVLDITGDESLGAPKHPHPAPKTSPEILKTLRWIQNTLDDRDGRTAYAEKGETDFIHDHLMPELNGCQVTFVDETRQETGVSSKLTYRSRNQVNLGDLDPTSLTSRVIGHDIFGDPVSLVRVHTTDKTPLVSVDINDRSWVPAPVMTTTDLDWWDLPSPYAERFVKALHHAITLCGGKASTF